MDPITFLIIQLEALNTVEEPDIEDYKDAIVEVFADIDHLTDEEVDALYDEFIAYKEIQQTLTGLADNLMPRIFR